jgi:hypothetical protein
LERIKKLLPKAGVFLWFTSTANPFLQNSKILPFEKFFSSIMYIQALIA